MSALRFRKPWPENVETAYAVEKIIRDADAVPNTMIILHDRITSFLTAADIDYPVT
ncbi:pseudouridine-5'-phosphate glycosidase [Endozoicomonas sp. ALC013]|uniref:pseudouridine-5'-phosphate glycosidase n=1 Tax=Endozoicomonas sp. ALC013 TaxID=3403076 RepID=UPI003BB597E5